jgi:PAS domain S-box-containing protein
MQNSKIEILLIEDDLTEADRIKEMLSKAPQQEFFVQHVQTLAAGLSQLQGRTFDIVLVDFDLPDSQGLEAALAVRNQSKVTPVVVLAVPDDEDAALKSLQMDIQDYLIKGDINGALLIRSIRYAIQRKHDVESMRGSEQRFTSFMLNLPSAAWMKDPMGRYVYGNAEHERIFSMPFSEYSCRRDEEFLPPETAGRLRKNDEKVLAEGRSLQTVEVLHKPDGTTRHFVVSKFPIPGPDGRAAYVAGIALDITEQKRAEEALRKSENKLARIFHAVPALISITTPGEGRIIDINETALQTLGYRRDELIGRTVREIDFWVDPSDRDRARQTLKEQGSVRNIEIRFRGKTGQTFVGLLSAELTDFDGDQYMLSLVRDITLRKQAEEEIERLNSDLTARAVELEDANRELEAFNYTVAHDLRKPLTVINGYCQAIRELCSDKLGGQCAGYLQEAYEGTLRMNRLIEALLDFSRLAHVELRMERLDLCVMAHEVATELQQAERGRRVTFRIADGIMVDGDANLLRVVLDNLLGNAWKYTGAQEEGIIEFGVTEIDGKRACFVRDNGPGFAMSDADKLFTPFQRLPGAEAFKGFGIGLATVERIIHRHGGRVWAEGGPGKGATFYFTL